MQDTLKDHDSTLSIGGRPIKNLRFSDDINLIEGHLMNYKNSQNKIWNGYKIYIYIYGMEISHKKSNILINDPDCYKVNSDNLRINRKN